MAVPEKRKAKHYEGDDFQHVFRIERVDEEGQVLGYLDLTGWGPPVVTTSDPNVSMSATITDAASGEVRVYMAAEAWGQDTPEKLDFDVLLTDPTGFRRTYLQMTLERVKDIEPAV